MNELINKTDNLPEATSLAAVPNLGFDCASFFSMHKIPFTHTPKKKHIFQHERFLHVKNTLLFGIASGEKLLKITGETGVGKTLLVNDVLSSIDHEHYPIRILNPRISPKDLLCQIIDEFGRPYPVDPTIEQLMRMLRFILHEHYTKNDAHILVWIDDAHLLSTNTLLIIDKISSWATPSRALLQFIISGSDELNTKLDNPLLKSVKNNIRFSDTLTGINKTEISDYVTSCVQSEERHDQPQFMPRALDLLFRQTNGNPSAINNVAYKALLAAYGKGHRTITRKLIQTAFLESYTPESTARNNKKWIIAFSAWMCVNVSLAIAYFGGFL